MTQTALADIVLADKGQLSRVTGLLERKGLIVRRELTWRSAELRLSAQGRRLYSSIHRISCERHLTLTAGVSARQLRQFYDTLDKIAANAGNLLKSLTSE